MNHARKIGIRYNPPVLVLTYSTENYSKRARTLYLSKDLEELTSKNKTLTQVKTKIEATKIVERRIHFDHEQEPFFESIPQKYLEDCVMKLINYTFSPNKDKFLASKAATKKIQSIQQPQSPKTSTLPSISAPKSNNTSKSSLPEVKPPVGSLIKRTEKKIEEEEVVDDDEFEDQKEPNFDDEFFQEDELNGSAANPKEHDHGIDDSFEDDFLKEDDQDDFTPSTSKLDKLTNLNKLNDAELDKVKRTMDVDFVKNQLKPGDAGYKYDKRLDTKPVKKSEWDE